MSEVLCDFSYIMFSGFCMIFSVTLEILRYFGHWLVRNYFGKQFINNFVTILLISTMRQKFILNKPKNSKYEESRTVLMELLLVCQSNI